ncbi:MAG TPA: LemA family protein [Ramlibacter sp.]|nr:LemA family protein [Ramlibacter sp.]
MQIPHLAFWTVCAILLFWAVGAYNRLMRLRAEAHAAFAAMETEFTRQIDLVRKQLPAPDATQPAPLEPEGSFWGGLHGAAGQFAASLAAARSRPLEPRGIAALNAAQEVLAMAWERAEREDAHDLAGARLPDTVLARRAQLSLQSHSAIEQFNKAVDRYNAAIAQFPAVLLAWLFGFRPGLGITAGGVALLEG